MYVRNLKIKNFRCFEDAEVSLNYPGRKAKRGEKLPERYPNINLFIGENGAGKTSIVKALCLAVLAPIMNSSGLRIDFFVRRPSKSAPGKSENASNDLAVETCAIYSELVTDSQDVPSGSTLGMNVDSNAFISVHGDTELLSSGHSYTSGDPYVLDKLFENDSPAFFLVAYGANRRAANPEGFSERSRSPRYQRIASLFEEFAGLIPFNVGYLELLKRSRIQEAAFILNSLLPDSTRFTPHLDDSWQPLFDSWGIPQPFSALSDGYRGLISWVWDLTIQLARIAPDGVRIDGIAGVVIVDEIDLFLHPLWQRDLIAELSMAFPNIQFLFSTHSPLVVGMLEAENIRVLRRKGDAVVIEQYEEEVEGKTPNELLRSVYFGLSSTRSPHSGTIAEQAAREVSAEGLPPLNEREEIRPLDEEQQRALERLMENGPAARPRASKRK